jgi:hypothetical protein
MSGQGGSAKKGSQVDDWHARLLQAAEARHAQFVRKGNRNLAKVWKDAVTLLGRNRKVIKVLKSGPNKGLVTGLPAKLAPNVVQVLTRIVEGDEEVLLPEHEGRSHIDISEEYIVTNRGYRDSIYAILAALYVEYQGPGVNPQPTAVVQRRAQRFTDAEMAYDYRVRQHGAWYVIVNS